MSVEWFCRIMGSEVGPLNQHQLVDMVRQHKLNPEDLVRRDRSQWVPAFEVKGLFEAAAKPPKEEPPKDHQSASEDSPEETPPAPKHKTKPQAVVASSPKSSDSTSEEHTSTREPLESASDWFCIASGEKRGPLGFDELQALARNGSLRGRDRVWRGSWPKFQRASEIDGLEATG